MAKEKGDGGAKEKSSHFFGFPPVFGGVLHYSETAIVAADRVQGEVKSEEEEKRRKTATVVQHKIIQTFSL